MVNRNAVFGTISDISRSERDITVSLTGDRTARFNPDDQRAPALASVLDDLRRQKMPAYLEIDPASGFITRVRIPDLVRVESIKESPSGDVSVTFERSHARYEVKRGSADAAELLAALREAAGKKQWLAMTSTDDFEVIDVRPYEPPFELPPFEPPPLARWWEWWFWPWRWFWWLGCVSKTRAQQLFDLVAATNCNPSTVPVPCIPFMYPDNGCWARAHEMCRLMIAAGASPRKVWIQGSLHTPTRNHPNCFVNWGWHVAPTLCVRKSWWWLWFSETQVIDPALFTTPVSQATWKGAQGDPSATLTPTSADQYYLGSGTDPSYTQTNIDLATYRTKLKNRSANDGPPPYAHCP